MWLYIFSIIAFNVSLFFISILRRPSSLAVAVEALSPLLAVAIALHISLADNSQHPRARLTAVIQVAWGLRLALFNGSRLLFFGKDPRLDRLRDHFRGLALLFAAHIVWIISISLPALVSSRYGMTHTEDTNLVTVPQTQQRILFPKDYMGLFIFTLGFLTEVLADQTKLAHKFVQIAANQPMVHCERGLWFYSQHPNYFGEILLWCGTAVLAWDNGLTGLQKIGVLTAPTVTALTIIFASGIPLADYRAAAVYGSFQEFAQYCEHTSKLVPLPRTLYAWLRAKLFRTGRTKVQTGRRPTKRSKHQN